MLKRCIIIVFKIVVIAHDIFSLASDDNDFLKKYIYNNIATKIVVHNKYSYNHIESFVKDKRKIHIIKQGCYIDILDKKVSKSFAIDKLFLEKNKKYVLFFGQIKKKKRLDVLLECFKYVSNDVKLIIAGKVWKDDFSRYQKIIDKNNLSSRIIKKNYFISDQERELLFKAADVMVLPFEEVYQSASVLMGMSYSLPVIASDIDGFKEFIKHEENGILFKKNNTYNLSKKINQIINDKKLYLKLQRNAYNTMKQDFSWSNIALQYKNILNFGHEI